MKACVITSLLLCLIGWYNTVCVQSSFQNNIHEGHADVWNHDNPPLLARQRQRQLQKNKDKDKTKKPSPSPTLNPTHSPSVSPTKDPTVQPTKIPTNAPTQGPSTESPTFHPSTLEPTFVRTHTPTLGPTHLPSSTPTAIPSTATLTLSLKPFEIVFTTSATDGAALDLDQITSTAETQMLLSLQNTLSSSSSSSLQSVDLTILNSNSRFLQEATATTQSFAFGGDATFSSREGAPSQGELQTAQTQVLQSEQWSDAIMTNVQNSNVNLQGVSTSVDGVVTTSSIANANAPGDQKPSDEKVGGSSIGLVAGAAAGGLLFAIFAIFGFVKYRRYKSRNGAKDRHLAFEDLEEGSENDFVIKQQQHQQTMPDTIRHDEMQITVITDGVAAEVRPHYYKDYSSPVTQNEESVKRPQQSSAEAYIVPSSNQSVNELDIKRTPSTVSAVSETSSFHRKKNSQDLDAFSVAGESAIDNQPDQGDTLIQQIMNLSFFSYDRSTDAKPSQETTKKDTATMAITQKNNDTPADSQSLVSHVNDDDESAFTFSNIEHDLDGRMGEDLKKADDNDDDNDDESSEEENSLVGEDDKKRLLEDDEAESDVSSSEDHDDNASDLMSAFSVWNKVGDGEDTDIRSHHVIQEEEEHNENDETNLAKKTFPTQNLRQVNAPQETIKPKNPKQTHKITVISEPLPVQDQSDEDSTFSFDDSDDDSQHDHNRPQESVFNNRSQKFSPHRQQQSFANNQNIKRNVSFARTGSNPADPSTIEKYRRTSRYSNEAKEIMKQKTIMKEMNERNQRVRDPVPSSIRAANARRNRLASQNSMKPKKHYDNEEETSAATNIKNMRKARLRKY